MRRRGLLCTMSHDNHGKLRIETLALVSVSIMFIAALVFLVIPETRAQSAVPPTLFERQIQQWCVKQKGDHNIGVDPCDITHFRKIATGDIHYLSPDPGSSVAIGNWTKHCPTFQGITSNISVVEINTQTNSPEIAINPATNPVCEADFTLTASS